MARTERKEATGTTLTSRVGSRTTRSSSGFTLVELIVVIVIAGLVAGLVTLSVARFQDKARFRASLGSLAATLRSARNTSIMDRGRCTFFFEEGELTEDGLATYRYGYDCDRGSPGVVRQLPEGYVLEGPSIAFFPKGYSSGGEIVLRDGETRGTRIGVDPVTGRVHVAR